MANEKDFCCVPNHGVIVPYQELEKMLKFTNNIDRYEKTLSRLEDQLLALRKIQSETIEKVGEIERSL